MPLRDHFHPIEKAEWQPLHGGWPMAICLQLRPLLPPGFIIQPRVYMGAYFELDIGAFDKNSSPQNGHVDRGPSRAFDSEDGGVATATWAPPLPKVEFETDVGDDSEYEVLLYDVQSGKQLVAAIELVSPSNKDRKTERDKFVSKCTKLLSQGVSVSIVDLVTCRHANLYDELLTAMRQPGHYPGDYSSPIYAVSCRLNQNGPKPVFKAWPHVLQVGELLPEIPIWLNDKIAVPLVLESSYELTCETVGIA